jgi:hypothetical protein
MLSSNSHQLGLIKLQAAAGIASIFFIALLNRCCAFFTKVHFILALFVGVTLWRHLQIKKASSQLYLHAVLSFGPEKYIGIPNGM